MESSKTFPIGTTAVSKMLGCDRHQLHYLAEKGVCKPMKLGDRLFWHPQDVLAAENYGVGKLTPLMKCVCEAALEAGDKAAVTA